MPTLRASGGSGVRDPRVAAINYAIFDASNSLRLETDENYLDLEPFAREVRRHLEVNGWDLVRIKPTKKRRGK
jgi:hypothetical protein